ncbi:MAG: LTA synthase family protein [Bacteroidota bacterium]
MIFLIYYFDSIAGIGLLHIISSFWHAIPLDISTACFAMVVPLVILGIQSVVKADFPNLINRIYFIFCIVLISLIGAGELVLYDDWGVKLHYKIFIHLRHPAEVVNTAGTGHYVLFATIFLLQLIPSVVIFNRYFQLHMVASSTSRQADPSETMHAERQDRMTMKGWKKHISIFSKILFAIILMLITLGLLFTGMRGGFQPIAINQSSAYFSKHNILNDAAVNPTWNLTHSTIENFRSFDKNPYAYYDLSESKKIVELLYNVPNDTTPSLLTTERPNIVLIILESWSADIIHGLGGLDSITPNFDSLAKTGVLFTNMYATGGTSDLAMPAILSGFHALPITSIVTQPAKYKQLPCINKVLKQQGYTSSYYYGGQLIYGNIKSYLYYNQFDRILDQTDFRGMPHGKLGIHDEFIFNKQLSDLNKEKTPFFSVIFTLSTHSPFDMPVDRVIHFNDKENMYLNSAYYTDACLGKYFNEAKTQKWFDNTLFILVADHSHKSPKRRSFCAPEQFKIPLLLYGNVIKDEFKGTDFGKIGSQVDIIATLLSQMNLNSSDFKWSKNLLNIFSPEFALYSWNDGFGWVRPYGYFAYDNRYKTYYHKEIYPEGSDPAVRFGQSTSNVLAGDTIMSGSAIEEKLVKEGRAYLQVAFREFMDY